MSILTYNELVDTIYREGVMTNVTRDQINGSSIDVTLGRYIWIEEANGYVVRLKDKQAPRMRQHDLVDSPYQLSPGEFILAQTFEMFNMPAELSAEFRLKSSVARAGIDQALAVWCDPYWHDSVLTLELRNNNRHHPVLLETGMKIGQMIFHRGKPVPEQHGYAVRGNYNNDATATPSKGVR